MKTEKIKYGTMFLEVKTLDLTSKKARRDGLEKVSFDGVTVAYIERSWHCERYTVRMNGNCYDFGSKSAAIRHIKKKLDQVETV